MRRVPHKKQVIRKVYFYPVFFISFSGVGKEGGAEILLEVRVKRGKEDRWVDLSWG